MKTGCARFHSRNFTLIQIPDTDMPNYLYQRANVSLVVAFADVIASTDISIIFSTRAARCSAEGRDARRMGTSLGF